MVWLTPDRWTKSGSAGAFGWLGANYRSWARNGLNG